MLADSHCHLHLLDLNEFDGNLDTILHAAEFNQVKHLLCVGTTLEDVPLILRIVDRYPMVRASVGLHPNEVISTEPTVEQLVGLASDPGVVAIGETGLDYYRTPEQQPWQRTRFETHIRAAKLCKKPLIIHTRMAALDTLSMLREFNAEEVGGVFHCFTEDWATAKAALDLGFYISFSGIVTFKNAVSLQAVAKRLPLDRLLIETDCPYLAPVPHRGKQNQPAYVKYTAEFIATLRGEAFEVFSENTTDNYCTLFGVAKYV